ncbi:MAG: hypothetical protein ACRD0Q_00660 [Acidimicrobiales bacterium]
MTAELIHQILDEDVIAIDVGDAAELALTCEHLCGRPIGRATER